MRPASGVPAMKLNLVLLRSTVVAALGGLLFGFDTVVISGANDTLKALFHLTGMSLGVTVASAIVGTVIGSMIAGIPGEKYGRRDSLRILAVLYLISAIGCALAPTWFLLLVSRIIGGLAIGGSSVLGPMYIAEIAPAKYRGRLVGLFQFNVVFGILLAFLSNYVIGTFNLGATEWRWKLGVAAIPAAFFLVMLFNIPRSPRWLAKKGRLDEAREVLRITGEEKYEQELEDIVASIDAEHHAGESLFKKTYAYPIFLAVSSRHVQPAFRHQRHPLLPEHDFRPSRLQQGFLGLASRRHRRHQPYLHHVRHDTDRQSRPQETASHRSRRHGTLSCWRFLRIPLP
jgi:MFS family permease